MRAAPLTPQTFLKHQTSTNHSALAVPNEGIDLLVLLNRLEDAVQGAPPSSDLPIFRLGPRRSTFLLLRLAPSSGLVVPRLRLLLDIALPLASTGAARRDIRLGAGLLELTHGVLGVHAAGHVAQTAESLKGVALGGVKESVQRARAEVVLPAAGRVNLEGALGVGECAQTTLLELLS